MKNSVSIYPNKQLFEKTRNIPKDQIKSDTFSQIGSSMLEILRKQGGIGLSANQVGVPLNMCVIELQNSDPKILLNPRITKMSDKMVPSKEGCLSLPGAILEINRHKNIVVEYEDVTGETQRLEAEGLLSCCLQHEIDHLKGILMINRVTGYHKTKALKQLHKYKKYRKQAAKS
jgi:peptide deformylase